ncbi:MAG: SMC family ATPase [Anaerolineae bacterium]|nr:SMC family ATPase [Anaerolineae bacterium]
MWITSVQLTNIKSYGPDGQTIPFKEGVNLIQGENGAGKSTILEAIGLALFDRKPYNLGSFVREGARTGRIEVGFFSSLDEREYVVVRAVGGSSQTYVYDPQIKAKVCEGRDDTLKFIRDHLQAEDDADLTTFFVDAVGVPQGTMTAIFRETAAARKEKFNRLLRMDAYEIAYKNLSETGHYIRDQIAGNQTRQAHLQGKLADLPNVTAAIDRITQELTAAEVQHADIRQQLTAVSEQRQAADRQRDRLDDLTRRVEAAAAELRVLDEKLTSAGNAVREAEAAQDIVGRTKAAYDGYEAAERDLAALQAKQQEYHRVQERQHELDKQHGLLATALDRLRRDLEGAVRAEEEMATLEPLVREQEVLEAALTKARTDQATLQQSKAQLDHLQGVLADLRRRMASSQAFLVAAGLNLVKPITESVEAEAENVDLAAEQARAAVTQLERAADRLAAAQAALDREIQEQQAVVDQVARSRVVQEQLDAARRMLDDLADRRRSLEVRLERLHSDQAQLQEYAALLDEAGAICPVCRRPMDAHAQAQAADHYQQEQERLVRELAALEAELDRVSGQLAGIEVERAGLQAELDHLPSAASLTLVEQRVQQAQRDHDDVAAEASDSYGRCQADLHTFERALEVEAAVVANLQQSVARLPELEAQWQALGDPRRRYERVQDIAATRKEIEEALNAQTGELERLETQLAEVEGQLREFADLDARLAAVAEEKARHEAGYREYLAHVAVAGQLEIRRAQLHNLEGQRAAWQADHAAVVQERDAVAAAYDAQAHEELRQRERELEGERVAVETRLEEWKRTLQAHQERLGVLQESQAQLLALEAELKRLNTRHDVLEFLRESIRKAGPEIVRQLVRLISEQANQIFGDILGDHSMVLNWDEAFGITVNQRGQQRDFELLSGGEQMVAAMAVRLALLMHLANVKFAFFDEPTTNLDDIRREQLAENLASLRVLQQLFVISHDDTFEQAGYHVIQVAKEDGLSQVRVL